MAHKITELKFNKGRKLICGSQGLTCEEAPAIGYINETMNAILAAETLPIVVILNVFSGYFYFLLLDTAVQNFI